MSQDSPSPPETPPDSAKSSAIPKVLAGVLVLAGIVALIRQVGPAAAPYVTQFTTWIDGLGVWAPVAFIVGYAVFAIALIPGSVLTMAGGALFGLGFGTLYVAIAATLGATGAFLISRYVARGRIEGWVSSNEKFAAVDRAIAKEGGKIVFLLRLSPAFPFSFLNYALGLTNVKTLHYVLASIGMLPGTFLYVYYGKAIGDVAALAAGAAPERGPEQWAFLGIGLVATLAVTTYVTLLARKALQEATHD